MKIVNHLKNPTVKFSDLKVGDVFMTLQGEVLLKLQNDKAAWDSYNSTNAFCLSGKSLYNCKLDEEVVPVETELLLKKNSYESYAK